MKQYFHYPIQEFRLVGLNSPKRNWQETELIQTQKDSTLAPDMPLNWPLGS